LHAALHARRAMIELSPGKYVCAAAADEFPINPPTASSKLSH
jgi:hypothetical protein